MMPKVVMYSHIHPHTVF